MATRRTTEVRVRGYTEWVASASSTSIAPAYPAGLVEGDQLYLIIHSKPSTTAPSTPSGWSLVGTATGGGGSLGTSTGPTRMTVFTRAVPSGGVGATQSVTLGSGSSAVAFMWAFHATGTGAQFEDETFGSWSKTSTSSTRYDGTIPGGLDLAQGDQAIVMVGATATDVGFILVDFLTATGVTTARFSEPFTTGTDTRNSRNIHCDSYRIAVISGASTGAVSISAATDSVATRTGMGFAFRVRTTALIVEAPVDDVGNVVVEPLAVQASHRVRLAAPSAVTVEALDIASVESIPRVHMRLGIGEVAVDPQPVVLHKILYLEGPTDVAVEPGSATVHHLVHLGRTDVVVEPLEAAIAGQLEPVPITVDPLPVQISYGSDGVGGQSGLIAVAPVNTTRFIAQNILTGQFLHWDLPITDPLITLTLSGPTAISGKLDPEEPSVADLLQVGLEPWACWLHVETDGEVRASGILQPWQIDGDLLSIEAVGPSAYPHGIPYLAELSGIQVDPADIVRAIWAHLQAYPDGRLNVVVTGTTPVKIGTPAYTTPKLDPDGRPEKDEDGEIIMEEVEAEPYELVWWEGTDCGSEIDNLAQETPFDYAERCAWNADHSGVDHWIDIGYPRCGTRRDDLRFATGENVTGASPVEEIDDQYASQVVLYGKGEGSSAVQGYAGRPLRTRLRRVAVIQDATVGTDARANALARDDLERRQALTDVTDLEVDARHINAQFGTYRPGDDIPIDVEVGWLGRLRQWERILSITYSPDSEAVRLELRRSEAFRYGGVA